MIRLALSSPADGVKQLYHVVLPSAFVGVHASVAPVRRMQAA